MAHIEQMSSHMADLIAAGEVVERPASVVKELVENAIDAGSTAVAVEVRRGGMGLIRVSDDGCGIPAAELPTAFLRHATSKLHSPGDLGKIGTLGFRGEALAAIAAVSRVEILSRERGAEQAASLQLEGGRPGQVEQAGAPEGTVITVRDLFFNTPARLKFMKKDSAETAAVAGLMQHLALSHPEISFRFAKDGVETLHTPGDGKLDSAVYAALGREFARTLLAVQGRGGEIEVRGFVTQPEAGRGSRSMQVFFVNGRFIKSQLLTAALEEGYRNQLMKGRFPGCVLLVTLPVTEVDVNVHPAKTVVKFSREKEVFDAVYHTVLDALTARGGAVRGQERQADSGFYKSMDAKTWREQNSGGRQSEVLGGAERVREGKKPWNTSLPETGKPPAAYQQILRGKPPRLVPSPPPPPLREPPGPTSPSTPPTPPAEERPVPPPVETPAPERPKAARITPAIPGMAEQQTLTPRREAPWRIAGEVLRTYIVCESGDGCIWLIDKHAAHERINFDRLKNNREPVTRQVLLTPAAVELSREDGALLLENLPLLEEYGFACEDFGGGAVLVREVPAEIDAGDAAKLLEEFAENLRQGRSLEERRENLLHTISCKAAIKGGWESSAAELQALVERVQSGEVRFCPHGRPVAVKMTRYEIEKMFGRA